VKSVSTASVVLCRVWGCTRFRLRLQSESGPFSKSGSGKNPTGAG